MRKDGNVKNRAERERTFFDELARSQGYHWWGNRSKAGQLRQDIRAEMAISLAGIDSSKKVLEVGCASGDFSRRIGKTGADITAIDISPLLIELAKSAGACNNIKYHVGNAELLQFENESFDAIIGNAVLHHLDLGRVLPEFRRVLKKGGKLFFAEPNMANPQMWLGHHVRLIGRRMEISPDETAFYRWSLRKTLQEHRFVNVEVRPFDFLHPGTPGRFIPMVKRLSDLLEKTWFVEIAGSLLVASQK